MRTSTKRVQAVAAGLLLTASGIGTAMTGADAAIHLSEPFKGQTVVVETYLDEPGPALIKEFKQQTGITIQWHVVGFDSLITKEIAALSANVYTADILGTGVPQLGEWAGPGWAVPLNKYFNVKQYLEQLPLAKSFEFNGQLVGVPVDSSTCATAVNAKDFKAAGITQMPTTFAQLNADLQKLKSSGVSPHPLDIPFAPAQGLVSVWATISWEMGGTNLLQGSKYAPTFAKPNSPGYRAISWMVNAYKDGLVPPANIAYNDSQGISNDMAENRTAVAICDYTDDIDDLYNIPSQSKVVGEIRYIPNPGVHGPAPMDAVPDGFWIPKTAKSPGAAAEFLKFITAPLPNAHWMGLGGPKYTGAAVNGPPVSSAALSLLVKAHALPQASVLAGLVKYERPLFTQGAPRWYSQFAASAWDNIHAAADGTESVSAAVASIVSTTNSLRQG